jgi:DNA-binding NarL/FixJ family response regulator
VLLADDHAVVRQAIRLLLEREGISVVGEAADGFEALRLARELAPDIVVLDRVMPSLNGLDAAREIRSACPRVRTILMTGQVEERYVLDAVEAGVLGCVLKTNEAGELIAAVREVCRGAVYLPPSVSRTVVDAYLGRGTASADPLTPREREVLQLIAEGNNTRQVAQRLGVSAKTAESHRLRITKKLAIKDTAGLVRYAIRHGLSPL